MKRNSCQHILSDFTVIGVSIIRSTFPVKPSVAFIAIESIMFECNSLETFSAQIVFSASLHFRSLFKQTGHINAMNDIAPKFNDTRNPRRGATETIPACLVRLNSTVCAQKFAATINFASTVFCNNYLKNDEISFVYENTENTSNDLRFTITR